MDKTLLKPQIKQFWNKKPCGTLGIIPEDITLDYFKKIKKRRYQLEPFIKTFAQFKKWSGKKVLEIGCGIGIDGLEFATNKADYIGIDASDKSLELARKYFELNNVKAELLLQDAEKLPFKDNSFDLVYSWGVLHHIPDTVSAINEIFRVLKPGGHIIIMLYNKYSLVGLQLYIKYGILKGRIISDLNNLYYTHHESLGTKAYTNKEVEQLFHQFQNLKIVNVITPYDLRLAKNIFLPRLFQKLLPSRFGFFKVITAQK